MDAIGAERFGGAARPFERGVKVCNARTAIACRLQDRTVGCIDPLRGREVTIGRSSVPLHEPLEIRSMQCDDDGVYVPVGELMEHGGEIRPGLIGTEKTLVIHGIIHAHKEDRSTGRRGRTQGHPAAYAEAARCFHRGSLHCRRSLPAPAGKGLRETRDTSKRNGGAC